MDENREKLREWVKNCPSETRLANACLIADRAVFRFLPLAFSTRDQLVHGFADLVLLRVLLTAHAACGEPSLIKHKTLVTFDNTDPGALVGRGAGSSCALMAFDAALFLMTLLHKPDSTARNLDRCIQVLLSAADDVYVSPSNWASAFDAGS